ncbi:MAG: 50S ribosomal protein L35 [Alphaproteobacteria bacterium]|nr:50S ribosomal protein L35 [Alphaproteobacteria bacterium]
MPKMKTKSGAKKRFKVTASGKVKFKQAHARHRLISKPQKMKRKARGTAVMFKADGDKVINQYLPGQRRKSKAKKARPANDNATAKKAGA